MQIKLLNTIILKIFVAKPFKIQLMTKIIIFTTKFKNTLLKICITHILIYKLYNPKRIL